MKKQLFCLLAIVFFSFSCKDKEATPPSAEFSIQYLTTKMPDRAPIAVQVTAKEDGATYQWIADGLTTGSGKTITVTFSSGGTKNITLTCTKNGITRSTSQSIVLKNPYTKMRVKSVKLNSYPTFQNGSWWDTSPLNSYADVYFLLTNQGSATSLVTGGTATDANPAQFVLWNINNGAGYDIPTAYNSLQTFISYYDYDSGGTDPLIGSLSFKVQDYISTSDSFRYPSGLTSAGSTPTEVSIEWVE